MKLNFEPTIFRDWSIAYCELAWISATKEFARQFGWSYSDFIFLWDGKKETIYRAREEHIHGMFEFIKERINRDKNFIRKVSQKLLRDIKKYEKLLNKWIKLNFENLTPNDVLLILSTLKKEYLPILPSFLIIMYFPQQLEQFYPEYQEKFKKEFKICLKTRAKVDKILAPLTEIVLRKIGEYVLKKLKIANANKFGRFLTLDEMRNILSKDYTENRNFIKQLKKILNKRSKYFLFAGGKVRYSSLKNYLKSKGWSLQHYTTAEKTNLIKGYPTYKVKKPIIGKVKIVENKDEISKILKGNILVAPMTTPEYAPIFKKVSAIITDEGGITSHAAIVSRELKIPCIVGTKIATKILKDGDLVEVDAEKGIVKILERTK
jgi:phosphohistidine swiveling domain-containing protein/uncharacterized protein YdhG (YjbR/CyaY superfamily)